MVFEYILDAFGAGKVVEVSGLFGVVERSGSFEQLCHSLTIILF